MSEERRRYFRVNDEAEISFRIMDEADLENWQQHQQTGSAAELAKLETEIGVALSHLKSQSPQVGKLLELLNQKINLVSRNEVAALQLDDQGELQRVNLSACGIAFQSKQPVPFDKQLLIQLKLKPSNITLTMSGRVVDSQPKDNGTNLLRVEFNELDSSNQDLLVQHMFQVQSRELQKKNS